MREQGPSLHLPCTPFLPSLQPDWRAFTLVRCCLVEAPCPSFPLQAKPSTLKKYAEQFELTVRPDMTAGELAVAVAR